MPPSVKAVDEFLQGYAAGDVDRVVANTWSGDRALVEAALREQTDNPNGPLAILLPPKPIEHEILEIADKESDTRQVILAMVRMKNPLPYASKRVGQPLPDIPKTRSAHRRFLSIREGERWGVKLDLAAVEARARFAERMLDLTSTWKLDEAEALLSKAPPPPDDPNALSNEDRLVEDLRAEIETKRKRRAKTSTTTEAQPEITGQPKDRAKPKSSLGKGLETILDQAKKIDAAAP